MWRETESGVKAQTVPVTIQSEPNQILKAEQNKAAAAAAMKSEHTTHSTSSVVSVGCANVPSVLRQCKTPYGAVDFCFGFLPNWRLILSRDATDIK